MIDLTETLRIKALFGVALRTLVKYGGTDSHHGINKSRGSLVKIPTFLDHIISALKQSGQFRSFFTHLLILMLRYSFSLDVSIQGILRKSPSLHVLSEIVNALNNGGNDGYTVDLGSLDPLTLASLFKKFLRDLPDPVLTGKLFPLFIAASREGFTCRNFFFQSGAEDIAQNPQIFPMSLVVRGLCILLFACYPKW